MSSAELHRAAEALLRLRLASSGIGLEPLPDLPAGCAMLLPGGRLRVAKVLVRQAPHRRGGRGDLGLHWLLRSDFEDYVALVDLSRQAVWLMSAAEFRSRAQPQRGGRWHLDWLVSRRGGSRCPDESEFERFKLEAVLETGDWKLEPAPAPPGPRSPPVNRPRRIAG